MAGKRQHFGSVRKLPSGRWQGAYWHNGRRHTAEHTFAAKADAQAWLAGVETLIRRGAWVDPAGGRIAVADLAARWLDANPTKRRASRARDETILRCHVLPDLGTVKVAEVTPADVQRLVDTWAGRQAASTVGRQHSTLRAMFAYAVAADLIARSPCRSIRVPRSRLVDRPMLDADQLGRLAIALGPERAPMMWLGAVGGLRWAECAGLQVQDLDLLGQKVVVARQLGRDGTLGPPKSEASVRRLWLPAWLTGDLAEVLARRGLTATDPTALVFATAAAGPLSYTNWRRRVWAPACAAAELPALRFHDLRSMAATALVAAGVDIKTAQTRMGHSSPTVTLGIYARMTEQADRDAADAVGGFFGPSRMQRARGGPHTKDRRSKQSA
ncbi:MAG: tyrosine-type recombinase/integrase [Acidimicrobiales bacterium]